MLTRNVKLWIAAIATVLITIVVVQNTESVETRLLFARVSMPRAVLLFSTLAIGFVLGLLIARRRPKKTAGAGK